jgi:hypothetical protein
MHVCDLASSCIQVRLQVPGCRSDIPVKLSSEKLEQLHSRSFARCFVCVALANHVGQISLYVFEISTLVLTSRLMTLFNDEKCSIGSCSNLVIHREIAKSRTAEMSIFGSVAAVVNQTYAISSKTFRTNTVASNLTFKNFPLSS